MRLLVVALVTLSFHAASAGGPLSSSRTRADEPVPRVESCQRRFAAACRVLHRCAPWAQDTGGANCEGIDSGCDRLSGTAPYSSEAVSRCVAELEALACPAQALDPNDPSALDFEAKTKSCKPLVTADARRAGPESSLARRSPRSR